VTRFGFGVNHSGPSAVEDIVELVGIVDSELARSLGGPVEAGAVGGWFPVLGPGSGWNSGVGELGSTLGGDAVYVSPTSGVPLASGLFASARGVDAA
jgi:hypothetical protein